MYWNSGIENAPEICQECVESWRKKNPEWELTVLDQATANQYVDIESFNFKLPQAAYSDVLRVAILSQEGGVWVDSTLFCIKPLDTWLPQLTMHSGFFAFSRPNPNRVISSWFLASSPDNMISQDLLKRTLKYLHSLDSTPGNYYWFHYLFEFELLTNKRFKRIWDSVPKVPADLAHITQRQYESERVDKLYLTNDSFVQKLTYKNGMDISFLKRHLLNNE